MLSRDELSKLRVSDLRKKLQELREPTTGKKSELVARILAHHAMEEGTDPDGEVHPDVMAESLQQLKVSELRDRLKGANLPTGGRKADLVARLEAYMLKAGAARYQQSHVPSKSPTKFDQHPPAAAPAAASAGAQKRSREEMEGEGVGEEDEEEAQKPSAEEEGEDEEGGGFGDAMELFHSPAVSNSDLMISEKEQSLPMSSPQDEDEAEREMMETSAPAAKRMRTSPTVPSDEATAGSFAPPPAPAPKPHPAAARTSYETSPPAAPHPHPRGTLQTTPSTVGDRPMGFLPSRPTPEGAHQQPGEREKGKTGEQQASEFPFTQPAQQPPPPTTQAATMEEEEEEGKAGEAPMEQGEGAGEGEEQKKKKEEEDEVSPRRPPTPEAMARIPAPFTPREQQREEEEAKKPRQHPTVATRPAGSEHHHADRLSSPLPSPRVPPSRTLLLDGLVRPLRDDDMRRELEKHGRLLPNGMFLTATKRQCYATYETVADAERARAAFHGRVFPEPHGRKLDADFSTKTAQEMRHEADGEGEGEGEKGGMMMGGLGSLRPEAKAQRPQQQLQQPRLTAAPSPRPHGASADSPTRPSGKHFPTATAELEERFQRTQAEPPLFYQPVEKDTAAQRLEVLRQQGGMPAAPKHVQRRDVGAHGPPAPPFSRPAFGGAHEHGGGGGGGGGMY